MFISCKPGFRLDIFQVCQMKNNGKKTNSRTPKKATLIFQAFSIFKHFSGRVQALWLAVRIYYLVVWISEAPSISQGVSLRPITYTKYQS